MKKCFFCKRTLMGKRYLGMCPKCFNNLLQLLLIVVMFIMIPVVATAFALFVMTPVSVILTPILPAKIAVDVVMGISVILGIITGYAIVIVLIVKFVANNRPIR